MFAQLCAIEESTHAGNVVPIRLRVGQRHGAYLSRWLAAGQRMGLHDAEITYSTPDGACEEGLVLIWVRESPDPAYRVVPERMRWLVIDHLRDHALGRFTTFEAALNFIRPVITGAIVAACG
jgi:hypothetical protein